MIKIVAASILHCKVNLLSFIMNEYLFGATFVQIKALCNKPGRLRGVGAHGRPDELSGPEQPHGMVS